MHLNNIFHDYALVKAPRDLIFGMFTQMTDRNDIRHINLHYLVIKGHKRSQKVIRGQRFKKSQEMIRHSMLLTCSHLRLGEYSPLVEQWSFTSWPTDGIFKEPLTYNL